MNKKAEGLGPLGAILLFLIFIVVWFVWLGSYLVEIGQVVIELAGFSGLAAFFFANLNFMILVVLMLAMLGYMYFGGGK
jgi:hypothetical protein